MEGGPVVQLVRMPACHAGGREFESRPDRKKHSKLSAFLFYGHFELNIKVQSNSISFEFSSTMPIPLIQKLTFSLVFITLYSCQPEDAKVNVQTENKPPNILWLIAEDMGPYIPPFGDSTIATPNLSRLASEGVRYTQVFSPSGVCAPSRASIALGMYPTSVGANHMRTHSHTDITGLRPYEAVPPPDARMLNQLMRSGGYYCTNNSKKDYQFKDPVAAWDESSQYAHWRNRQPGQPFYSVFTFTTTHESGLFEPYGFKENEMRYCLPGDTSFQLKKWSDQLTEEETTAHLPKNTPFEIPPYLPDNEVVRRDLWTMYNNNSEMDQHVGAILNQLEVDGLLDETIIFFFADHGGPLPRQKRLVYDAGLRVPMIVRFPEKVNAGQQEDRLISFLDLAPTVLELADLDVPDNMQGFSFLSDAQERDYIHAAGDRFDGFTDAIRAVRDDHFKYIRNYRPEQGYYMPIAYRERIPSMRELLKLKENDQLNKIQSLWFREQKPREELYDCLMDPHELNNLAENPDFASKLTELSNEMDRWLMEIGDDPNLTENALIEKLWNGAEEQPTTSKPAFSFDHSLLEIKSATEGANISYRRLADTEPPQTWQIYEEPLLLESGDRIEAIAHRIGFKASQSVVFSNSNTKK